ncbi:MAG: DUF429 domain-containing protein [Coriobacteriia bacterium]|nr:DUF429 domain-containing protein [Coriobacteriia bacterium]
MTIVCGADGCRDGWVVVWHATAEQRLWWEVRPTLTSTLEARPTAEVIGIDSPIGLVDRGARECDLEARRRLGFPRSSSVFPAPIRPLLDADSYAAASAIRQSVEGKSVSVQAWGIVARVRAVDELMRFDPGLSDVVREIHPELCFMQMNDGEPLVAGKRYPEGRRERADILRRHFGAVVDEALASKPAGCGADDLLDAFAVVWTAARIANGEAITIPDSPPRDRFGLRMEMVI